MTPIERLQMYHSGEKVKIGNAYFAAPEPAVEPKPPAPDPVAAGLEQAASAYLELSRIYRNLED